MAARDRVGPVDRDHEERRGFGFARELRQQFERRVVGPMEVIEHEGERPCVGHCDHRFADAGKERGAVGGHGAARREQHGEPVQRLRGAWGARIALRRARERGDRAERRGGEGARCGVHGPEPRGSERSFHERGLADARLARDEDDPAAAFARFAGKELERRQLLLATDEPRAAETASAWSARHGPASSCRATSRVTQGLP